MAKEDSKPQISDSDESRPAKGQLMMPGQTPDPAESEPGKGSLRAKTKLLKMPPISKSWWREMVRRNEVDEDLESYGDISAPAVSEHGNATQAVAWTLRVSAAWAWRLIVVGAVAYAVGYGVANYLYGVAIPILIALLMALLLEPLNDLLRKLPIGKAGAAALSTILGITLVGLAVGLASKQLAYGFGDLVTTGREGFEKLMVWLREGPLQLKESQIDEYLNQFNHQFQKFVSENSSTLAGSAWSITSKLLEVVTILLISLFCLFFFLKDGRSIWVWLIRMLPVPAREPAHEAGIRGWATLKGYIKAQVLVAAVDSVSIAIGAFFLGVGSLTIPLGVIIFLGCFIPIVGSLATGALAVLVVLMNHGLQSAVIMLIIIVVVNQVEGNILQPVFMSSAVSLHPLAVLLSVAAGTYLAGILGALFAVPLVAFLNTVVLYLSGHDTMPKMNTKVDRVGGPPGRIHTMVYASYLSESRAERKARELEEKAEIAAAKDAESKARELEGKVQAAVAKATESKES